MFRISKQVRKVGWAVPLGGGTGPPTVSTVSDTPRVVDTGAAPVIVTVRRGERRM
jgi:hypothetical protein